MRRRVRAGFEPPTYIASLITSINYGAKAAQTGGLFMLADTVTAIPREKQIKAWSRRNKIELIEGMNPDWRDRFSPRRGYLNSRR